MWNVLWNAVILLGLYGPLNNEAKLLCGPLSWSRLVYEEGDQPTFWCQAEVPATGEDPVLEWYTGDDYLESSYEELNDTTIVRKLVSYNVTKLDHLRSFRCLHLGAEPVNDDVPATYLDECVTSIKVQYAPYHIQFEPSPSDFEDGIVRVQVGDTINCSADGRPKPTLAWREVNGEGYSDGATLEVKEDMLPERDSGMEYRHRYACEAKNFIEGQPNVIVRQVDFIIDTEKEEDGETTDSSWKIPVILLCIIFTIGVVVAVVFFVKYKRDMNRPHKLNEDTASSGKGSPERFSGQPQPQPRPADDHTVRPAPGQRSPDIPRGQHQPVRDDDRYKLPPPRSSERPRSRIISANEPLAGYGGGVGTQAPAGESFI